MRIVRYMNAALAAAALGLGAARSDAGPITDLYSTGDDNNHVTLGNGVQDTHYTLVSSPVSGTSTYVVNPNGFPIPPWVANDPVGTAGGSMWISGPSSPVHSEPDGTYDYRTTFTLGAGLLPSTASITGELTADDRVEVLLNGEVVVPFTPDQGYGHLYDFSITSGFVSGANTLDFVVANSHGSVEGLRVDMTGSAVPEPSSLVLLGLGTATAGLLGYVRLRRRAG